MGYTRCLRYAGCFSQEEAIKIEREANKVCEHGEFNEIIFPDPRAFPPYDRAEREAEKDA